MTKTDTYKETEQTYSKRVPNLLLLSLVMLAPFLMLCMLVWYKPPTDMLGVNIVITIILIVIPLIISAGASGGDFVPPKDKFNKKVVGTVKEKVLCKNTSAIYTVEGELMYSTDKVYFELQEGTKYTFLINKYKWIGKYKPIITN